MKVTALEKANDYYNIFKPQLTPKKMLELGVFGGSYFGGKIKEYPKSWFKKAKLSKTFDVEQNCFRVAAGLSRKEWIDNNWDSITKTFADQILDMADNSFNSLEVNQKND